RSSTFTAPPRGNPTQLCARSHPSRAEIPTQNF
ncbi:hypothetical protein STRIP9103_07246, partial [Streptomyces ipomoeae 91-03]